MVTPCHVSLPLWPSTTLPLHQLYPKTPFLSVSTNTKLSNRKASCSNKDADGRSSCRDIDADVSGLQKPFLFDEGFDAKGRETTVPKTDTSVLDGGFVVPENNSFGHSFRAYGAESERNETVEELYRLSHINQTYDFVKGMRETYTSFNRGEMGIWECCELLNDVVDNSDPDLDEPQIQHLLQTAESIRKEYPDQDWLHLTALIHDLGKVLLLPKFGALPQWAVVGDTFPLGCAFDTSIVHYEHFEGNPDCKNPAFNSKLGVYSEGCGLDNVAMSWGHDEYMFLVAKESNTTLPSAALFTIRYHSFYSLHASGAYKYLMNKEDVKNLKWLEIFSKYDLYTKSKVKIHAEKVKPYYVSLADKYFPPKLKW